MLIQFSIGTSTYSSISFVTKLVQIAELSLTLVELVEISLFKSNSGVSLIYLQVSVNNQSSIPYLNTKVILDALDR